MPTANDGRLAIIYPKHVTTYLDCPERYFHERVERRRVEQPFSPALAKSILAHELLATAAEEYRRLRGLPADLRRRIESQLPRAPYPTDKAWRADVDDTWAQVEYGLTMLDGIAEVVSTETTYTFAYPPERASARGDQAFVLASKIDLVRRCQDEAGQPYLDIVDYKGGRRLSPDPIQAVASRIVVRAHFPQEPPTIRTTTVFLGGRHTRTEELSREQVQGTWGQIKQVVNGILAGGPFPPQRSPLCEYCPFFQNGCSLDAKGNENDDLADWLDEVAD